MVLTQSTQQGCYCLLPKQTCSELFPVAIKFNHQHPIVPTCIKPNKPFHTHIQLSVNNSVYKLVFLLYGLCDKGFAQPAFHACHQDRGIVGGGCLPASSEGLTCATLTQMKRM